MEIQKVIDKENGGVADTAVVSDNVENDVFYKYRGIGKCISDGVSFITDNFFLFVRQTLPVHILLALFGAACAYLICEITLQKPIESLCVFGCISIALIVLDSVFSGIIFRFLKLHSKNMDVKRMTFSGLYKSVWKDSAKVLGYNVLNLLFAVVAFAPLNLLYLIKPESLGMKITIFCFFIVWLLVIVVASFPYQLSLPTLILGKKSFFKGIWHGYVLGVKKIGKVISLSIVVFIIVALISVLFFAPAIVVLMIRHSASISFANGDAVCLPDKFEFYSALILFVSSFLLIFLKWLFHVPMAYLYASIIFDMKEQKKHELPMI